MKKKNNQPNNDVNITPAQTQIPLGIGANLMERNILGQQIGKPSDTSTPVPLPPYNPPIPPNELVPPLIKTNKKILFMNRITRLLWTIFAGIFCFIMLLSSIVWLDFTSQGHSFLSENFPSFSQWLGTYQKQYTTELMIVPVIIITLLGLLCAKLLYQKTIPYHLKNELINKKNPAVGLYIAGFFVAIMIALLGSLSGLEYDPLAALCSISIALFIVVPALRISAWCQERIFLYKLSLSKELQQDRNLGVGSVMCGSFIGTGFILQSCFIGDCTDWITFIFSIIVAFCLGQIIFLIGGSLFKLLCGYNFNNQLKNYNNTAVGVMLGSFLVGLGLVVSASVTNLNLTQHLLLNISYQNDLQQNNLQRIRPLLLQQSNITLSSSAYVTSSEGGWCIVDLPNSQMIQIRMRGTLALEASMNQSPTAIMSQIAYASLIGFFGIILLLVIGRITILLILPKMVWEEEILQQNSAIALIQASIYIIIGAVIRILLLA